MRRRVQAPSPLPRRSGAARLWQEPAGKVPYQPTLTVEQRIAGLTAFWSEARANFVYFDHVPDLDWNQTYLDFVPKVMAAQSTRDFYAVMMRLAALLNDAHTSIYPPAQLQDHFTATRRSSPGWWKGASRSSAWTADSWRSASIPATKSSRSTACR